MDRNRVLRHVVLSSVFSILRSTSCYQTQFGADPACIALGSPEHDFKPAVAVPIIMVEKVRSKCNTTSIAHEKIWKSIIVIIGKGGIRAPSLPGLGLYPSCCSNISKSAVSIVPEKPVGQACGYRIYNVQI